ncbi:hypothetical protein MP965_26055 [Escherichia coli]|nr:hypothetical protein [Escherichia coli]
MLQPSVCTSQFLWSLQTFNMHIILFSVLAAVALAQQGNDNVIDDIHGYRVEYDDRNNIILFVSQTDCYIVEAADGTWDPIVRNHDDLVVVTDEIYAQIMADRGITSLTEAQAAEQYDSNLEQWQCRGKHVHRVRYSPAV